MSSYDKTLRKLVTIFMRFFNESKDEALKEVLRFSKNFVSFDQFARYILFKLEENLALDDKTRDELLKALRRFYEREKKAKSKQLNIEYKFKKADEAAMTFADRLNDFYLGKFFQGDARVKNEAISWMRRYYLQKGNPIGKSAGVDEFLRQFGDYLSEKGKLKARQIIDTTMNTMRNIAHVNSYYEAGIEKFRWDATNDRLTCAACRSMDGRIIYTKEAKDQIDRLIASKPEDLPKVRPINTKPFRGKTADFPIKTPPMHPLCRCTTEAEFSGEPVSYKIERPEGVPITSDQIELENTFKNMTDEEIHNRIKAHLGDVWWRVRKQFKEKHLKNMLKKAILDHYEKHKAEFGNPSFEEYKNMPYKIIKKPDKIFVEFLKGQTYYNFYKDGVVVPTSDDNMSIMSLYKVKDLKEWMEERIQKGSAMILLKP